MPLQAPAQNRAERARSENAERVQRTSASLAVWHGTLAAGGCSAAVSAQVWVVRFKVFAAGLVTGTSNYNKKQW